MAYLNQDQLLSLGFKSIGVHVKISDKASIYDCEQIEIGDHSRIDDFCVISGSVTIGKYCHITPMCLVAGGTPGITFSDFTTIAYGVKIFSQSDDYSGGSLTNSLIPKKYKKEIFEPVILGRHVIVGANSIVMPGVYIGEGCSVGAMSLVNISTDPWGIYFGVPAKRMKERKKSILELEKQFLTEISNDPL
ncbi:dTDP-4-amino-4,6-dideoxy-D-glucose acyltransferase [Limnobacter sp. 130]|uniref:acyltransferase n=1 Tax=Limnobacter sp. 130 TaxID=2653147 RepID=UPI0012F38C34|nr:acyltransferase [Limnobacter sp. 130]VWX32740.1 dTDP-4-amino-4,6-dideoxy-D-glucose acyltransferase [Limnobacter sp. 130]